MKQIKPSAQVFKSRIDPKDFEIALSKLYYEIKLRKKEFISLCSKEDPNFTSKIDSVVFATLLDKFTVYPNDYEKKIIIYKLEISNKYIDYVSIAETPHTFLEPYRDLFLTHLNDERFKKYRQQKLTANPDKNKDNNSESESDTSLFNNFGLTPIEILNAEINEENFMRKISKDLITYILTHTKGERPKEYMDHLYKSMDFDQDGKFTIGELNNLFTNCDMNLGDADLRFFFEYFPVINGRIDIEHFNNFIEINSEKNFEKTTNIAPSGENQGNLENMEYEKLEYITDEIEKKFETQKTYHKKMEDQRMYDTISNNYLINNLKNCLLLFGKEYLLEYFGKYLFEQNDVLYIEDNNFIMGINSLGYIPPSSLDISNFKYVCIHKNIGAIKGLTNNVTIDIEKLFEFVIEFFEIGETIKVRTPEQLVISLGKVFNKEINKTFIGLVGDNNVEKDSVNDSEMISEENKTPKEEDYYAFNNIKEKDFRKKFIDSFGFIDHLFFDKQIRTFCCDEKNELNDFNPNVINAKKFIDFSYNFLFLYMLKNYNSLGLLLDKQDQEFINILYYKIINKFFKGRNLNTSPNSNLTSNKSVVFDNNDINTNTSGDIKKIRTFNKSRKNVTPPSKINEPSKKNYIKKENIKTNNINDENAINEYYLTRNYMTTVQINGEMQNIPNENQTIKPIVHIVDSNPIEAIPILYKTCAKYIIEKFKLEKININLLKGIGVCKIFRDRLNNLPGGMKPKMHWIFLIRNIEHLFPEVVKNFLTQIAIENKDTDGNINVQFFFSKIEDILLRYHCALDEEKHSAKYFV